VHLPEAAGPADPLPQSPPRRPGTVRRTSTIDVTRPEGMDGDLVVDARARDLRTDADGPATVLDEVVLRARLGADDHRVVELVELEELDGSARGGGPLGDGAHGLASLVGERVGSGFRARLDEVLGDEVDRGSLRHLLLDDLPGAVLISGYARQRAAFVAGQPLRVRYQQMAGRADICAGWAGDATILTTVRDHGVIPVPMGPPAPTLEPPDDPLAWHPAGPLPPRSTRRRRLLDLGPATEGALALRCHFRDSHVDDDGHETVLHEYSVTGAVDVSGTQVLDLAARAQVLPWVECPGAVDSARRLAGAEVATLRRWVRRELTGVSTCTHLNDTLRSLADVSALAGALGR
jgi:hypothetical protein